MSIYHFLSDHWLLSFVILGIIAVYTKRKITPIYRSRREAFRAAKRANGIPMSMQPIKVIRPNNYEEWKKYKLDNRNVVLYIFEIMIDTVLVVTSLRIFIRQDKAANYEENGQGDQPPHFNAGQNPDNLDQHYYYEEK
jgi:hypothetical protein